MTASNKLVQKLVVREKECLFTNLRSLNSKTISTVAHKQVQWDTTVKKAQPQKRTIQWQVCTVMTLRLSEKDK